MKQVLAGLGAVAMVVAAVFVRDAIEGDDGAGGGDRAVVTCPPELEAACASLADDFEVRVEEAAVTAEALLAADDGAEVGEVWLVPAPWAEAVRAGRDEAGAGGDQGDEDDDEDEVLVGEPGAPLARSPVVLALWEDRAAALEAGACGGTLTWSCLGEAADRPWSEVGGEASWGRVKVGLTDPDSATGLVVLGGAASGYFGSDDYASNDFDGTLSAWLGALGAESESAARGEPVNSMLMRGPGAFSAVGALEVEAREAAGRDRLRVVHPVPTATADLVAVPLGEDGDECADDVAGDGELAEALAGGGWRVEGEPAAEGVDTGRDLPTDDGLPEGDVLRALSGVWDSATR